MFYFFNILLSSNNLLIASIGVISSGLIFSNSSTTLFSSFGSSKSNDIWVLVSVFLILLPFFSYLERISYALFISSSGNLASFATCTP